MYFDHVHSTKPQIFSISLPNSDFLLFFFVAYWVKDVLPLCTQVCVHSQEHVQSQGATSIENIWLLPRSCRLRPHHTPPGVTPHELFTLATLKCWLPWFYFVWLFQQLKWLRWVPEYNSSSISKRQCLKESSPCPALHSISAPFFLVRFPKPCGQGYTIDVPFTAAFSTVTYLTSCESLYQLPAITKRIPLWGVATVLIKQYKGNYIIYMPTCYYVL